MRHRPRRLAVVCARGAQLGRAGQRARGLDEAAYLESSLVLNAVGGDCIEQAQQELNVLTALKRLALPAELLAARPKRLRFLLKLLTYGFSEAFFRHLQAALQPGPVFQHPTVDRQAPKPTPPLLHHAFTDGLRPFASASHPA